MSSFYNCMKMETESLKKYLESRKERLLNSVEGEGILGGQKMKKELLEAKSMELYRKAIMFSICEENRWK